ncbi:MAG: ABC transporter permease, partial [Gemmatimonadota bacterium]|jgi:putative ABC transport system permease protein
MAFGVCIALAVGILSGLFPALRGTRDLTGVLKAGGRGNSAGVGSLRRPTFLAVVAAAQVATALVLLTGAAQLLEGYRHLRSIDPGFVPSGLLTFRVSGPDSRYGGPAAAPLIEQVLERIEAVPGVVSASVSFCPPLRRCSSTPVYFKSDPDPAEPPTVGRHYVAPTHFRTLGIPLLRGRLISEEDRAGRPRVAVINETAADRLWPGEDPIGRRVWFGSGGGFASPDSATEIIGVVGDVLYARPGDPIEPDFYTSYLQFTWPEVTVLVRTDGSGTALVPALAGAIAEVDPDLPVFDVRTMDQLATDALAAERFASWTVTIFAGIGLLLAALGVYGVMAYMAAQRRREIGIRMALGAAPQSVLKLVIGHGLALAGIGAAAGTLASLWLVRLLSALVVDAGTPRTTVFAVALPVLLLVTLLTCYLPARAAARVSPMETMAAD